MMDSLKKETRNSSLSDWRKLRPNTDLDFILPEEISVPGLVTLSDPEDISILLEDLFSCLMGRTGELIIPEPLKEPYSSRCFIIHVTVPSTTTVLAHEILKLASHYSTMVRFIQDCRYSNCGRVNQSFSAALNTIRCDYLEFVVQLRKRCIERSTSIHNLWLSILPTRESFSFLETIILAIVKQKSQGAKTLSILHEFASRHTLETSDTRMALFLIKYSSKPYFESLQKWIYRGEIFDPYNEFMIFRNSRISTSSIIDQLWSKKYLVHKEKIPCFLFKVSKIILKSGKYLDCASSCSQLGISNYSTCETAIKYSNSPEEYILEIERAYTFASKLLLGIIKQDYDIIGRMKSVKRYFLLEQGDFILTVFDICQDELLKNISDIIPSKFSALLEIAVRIPSTDDDSYRDDIFLSLKPLSLIKQVVKILSINTEDECKFPIAESAESLTGIDAFAISLKSQWPVSLIFCKKIMSCYQMLFRHIVYTRYIEMLLCKVWLRDTSSKPKSNLSLQYYHLRHRMLHFVQNVLYYMMTEAIETNWFLFMSQLQTISSIDDLLKWHWVFINACIKDCLLGDISLLLTFRNLLNICLHFTEFVNTLCPERQTTVDISKQIKIFQFGFNSELSKFIQLIYNTASSDASNKMHSLLCRLE